MRPDKIDCGLHTTSSSHADAAVGLLNANKALGFASVCHIITLVHSALQPYQHARVLNKDFIAISHGRAC